MGAKSRRVGPIRSVDSAKPSLGVLRFKPVEVCLGRDCAPVLTGRYIYAIVSKKKGRSIGFFIRCDFFVTA